MSLAHDAGIVRWSRSLFPALALVAACSSSGGTGTSSGSSTTSGAGGAGGGGPATSTSTSTSTSSGTGGAPTCASCVTVVTLPPGSMPYGLFVDATNLYWTNFGSGEVMQAKLDGSSPITLTTGEMAPIAVQAQDGFVYWVSYAEEGLVRTAPVGGGAVTDLAPGPAARDLFVGAGFIWWTGEPDDVQRAPIAGLPDGGMPILLTNNTLPNGLTADASNVYWVDRFSGTVAKGDHDLGNVVQLAQGDIPWDIAVDATSVYWTEQGSPQGMGKVMKASKADGSGVTTLASEAAGTQGLAIDATHVYWANKSDGTIKSAPLSGGAATIVAAGQSQPNNLVVDGVYVYWTSSGADAIVKAPK